MINYDVMPNLEPNPKEPKPKAPKADFILALPPGEIGTSENQRRE